MRDQLSDRKELMKRLVAEAGEVWRAVDPRTFSGERIVASMNTTYKFIDGVCVAVDRFGVPDRDSTFLGMRIVGWLFEDADGAYFSGKWKSTACAVLWGKQSDAIALTSPTIDFRRRSTAPTPEIGVRKGRRPMGIVAARADSVTRIHVSRTPSSR
jgi:hypothetical protein